MIEEQKYKPLLLAIDLGMFGDNYYSYEDFYLFHNEKLLSYSISLISEIDHLIEQGISKDEIINIIMNCNFTEKDPRLTEGEGNYLKNYSLKLLNIRYEIYLERLEYKKDKKELNKQKKLNKEDLGLS
ncbi:MAG: hypothetical protein IJG68_02505 [Bacilli bacterium]|nr:hypothetical protein [Bacilli bacterium]